MRLVVIPNLFSHVDISAYFYFLVFFGDFPLFLWLFFLILLLNPPFTLFPLMKRIHHSDFLVKIKEQKETN